MRVNHLVAALAVTAAAVTIAAAAGCSSSSQDASPDQQWALVQNHFFIDHMPGNRRDMVKRIAFVDSDGQRVGIRGQGSAYRHFLDLFTWDRRGAEVNTVILQTGEKVNARFKAYTCSEKRFELCLELRAGDQVRKYYSRKDWIIEGTDEARTDALLETANLDDGAAESAAVAADEFPL